MSFICELYTIVMCLDCDVGQTEEMDLIFVLDDSGNIGPLQFEYLRQFVMQTSLELDIGPQNSLVGAILYDSSPSLEFGVTQNTNETSLLSAITNLPYSGGGSNTSAALDLLRTAGQPGGALNLRDGYTHNAIVVTDGGSTSQSDTMNAANALHAAKVCDKVYAIGVNMNNTAELEAIASDPSLVFSTTNFDSNIVTALQQNVTQMLMPCVRKSYLNKVCIHILILMKVLIHSYVISRAERLS